MGDNAERGIRLILEEIRDISRFMEQDRRQAAEDRRQFAGEMRRFSEEAAQDRAQAAKDRKEFGRAITVIGRLGIRIAGTLDQHTPLLREIVHRLRVQGNGRSNGRGNGRRR